MWTIVLTYENCDVILFCLHDLGMKELYLQVGFCLQSGNFCMNKRGFIITF